MDDLISRQAAIDALAEFENYEGHNYSLFRSVVSECAEVIRDVPSAQPSQGTQMSLTKCEDVISRRAAIDALGNIDCSDGVGFRALKYDAINDAVTAIKALPSAQPEIIACGDCKHWICHDRRCGYWNHGVKPLDWCCHAERRTDG